MPCFPVHRLVRLTVTPPGKLTAMKLLFTALSDDLAHRVRVTWMRNPVHYDVTYSPLARLWFTAGFEVYIQSQAMHFVPKVCTQ